MRVVTLLLFASLSLARADDEAIARARAAMAMEAAKAEVIKPITTPKKGPMTDLEAAKKLSIETRRPILVRYGDYPCLTVCTVTEKTIVVHLDQDSGKPRLRLMVHSPGESCWYWDEWDKECPTKRAVEEKIKEFEAIRDKASKLSTTTTVDWLILSPRNYPAITDNSCLA